MSRLDRLDANSSRVFAQILAKEAGMTIVFDDTVPAPCTDVTKKVIKVRPPHPSWSEGTYLDYKGKLVHEIGHWRDENREIMERAVEERINMSSLFGKNLNIVGDLVNDYQWTRDEWPGAAHVIQLVQKIAAADGIATLRKDDGWKGNKELEVLIHVLGWAYCVRADTYQVHLLPEANEWEKEFPGITDLCEKFTERALTCLNSPTWENVRSLAWDLTPPEYQEEEEWKVPEPPKGPGEGEEGGDGEEKEGDEGEEGDTSDDAKGDEKDSEKESKKKVFISYAEILMADDHGAKDMRSGSKPNKAEIKYDHEFGSLPYEGFETEVVLRVKDLFKFLK